VYFLKIIGIFCYISLLGTLYLVDTDNAPGACGKDWEMEMEKSKKEQYFFWIFKGVRIILRGSEIWYVSCEQGKTLVHTRNRVYQIGGPLKEEVRKLQELPMVKVHNSFLVNMDKLEVISAKGAMLKNQVSIPVSRGCWGTARVTIEAYYRDKCSSLPQVREDAV
jgi:hypothetical protein